MKKLVVDHSKFVLALGGCAEHNIVLSTEGDWIPVHKAVDVFADHPVAVAEEYQVWDG